MNRAVRFGLWSGLSLWVWMTIIYGLQWQHTTAGFYAGMVSALLLGLFIYLAVRYRRDQEQGGQISFREAFLEGMTVSFVTGLMAGIYLLVYSTYINPQEVEMVVEQTRQMYEARNVPPERIEQAVRGVRASYSKFGRLTYGIGQSMLTGALISLICAAIMRRNTPNESQPEHRG